jgi:heme/copper-type cytochrome/quinol oxidase subunit 2
MAFSIVASIVGFVAQAPAAADSQSLIIYVFGGKEGIKGPDGNPHDTVVPSSFVIKAGQPVNVTVINYDESPHSITSSELGINLMIKPGKEVGDTVQPVTTTFTFTAQKPGVYRWSCVIPCDKGHGMWAMGEGYGGPGKEGFMAGNIVVVQ